MFIIEPSRKYLKKALKIIKKNPEIETNIHKYIYMKKIQTIIPYYNTMEGGFQIRRPFPGSQVKHLDPFLLLDYFGPMDVPAGKNAGVSAHPHRGFETVTYLIQGEIEHKDSNGDMGVIKPGGIQWMTAAGGIVHQEFPSNDMKKTGGTLQGIQLWINLPAKHKMDKSKYQDLSAKDLPLVKKEGYTLRVIAGEYDGQQSPAQSFTPITYYHLEIEPNQKLELEIPKDYTNLVFSLENSVWVADQELPEANLAIMDEENTVLKLSTQDKKASFIILAGQKINEPVVSWGPFVMNNEGEIRIAMLDYQLGKMGEIN